MNHEFSIKCFYVDYCFFGIIIAQHMSFFRNQGSWDDFHRFFPSISFESYREPGRLPKISEFATSPASACGSCKAHVEYLQARGFCRYVKIPLMAYLGVKKSTTTLEWTKIQAILKNSKPLQQKERWQIITGSSPKNKHVNYQNPRWPKTSMEESLGWRLSPMPPSPQWIWQENVCVFWGAWWVFVFASQIYTHSSVSKKTKLWNDSWMMMMMIIIIMRIIMIMTPRRWEWW